MKHILLIFGLLLTSLTATSREPVVLRIMTYNIAAGRQASLEQLAGFIRGEEPDFVALQELDYMTRRNGAGQHDKDIATELGYRTGLMPLYGKTIPHAGGFYGIGMLTRHPYISSVKTMLPQVGKSEEPRALLRVLVELPSGDTIVFASTHIDFTSDETKRLQIEAVQKELEACRYPVILGGDFNAQPGSPALARFFARWQPLSGEADTYPGSDREAPVRIDYLFGWPAGRWKLIESRAPQIGLSDHLPVISTVELLPAT